LGEKIEIGAIYRALGQIYTAKKGKEKAKENFEKSISILGEIEAKYELAKTYLEAGRSNAFGYLERIVHLSKSKEIFKELEVEYYVGAVDLAFAEFFFDNEEYDKAEAFLEEAEKFFEESNEAKALELALELKAKLNKAQSWIEKKIDPESEYLFSSVITQDPQMLRILEKASGIKDSDITLLLEGETGTGKDLLAMAIHYESKRSNNNFVKVNCAAIPDTLLESELFGYKKGAFTGADQDKIGFFEQADAGTIFLNEIGDLHSRLQAKILDVIEDKVVTRIGEVKPRRVDFRVIAATNKNLDEEIAKGNFRSDLHYRLNVVKLTLPPLRERKNDIPVLIDHFLKKHSLKGRTKEITFEPEMMSVFASYDWPGNIRELQNEIMKLIVENNGNKLNRLSLSSRLHKNCEQSGNFSDKKGVPYHNRIAEYEKDLILKALEENDWIKEKAAKALRIPVNTLKNKIKKNNICRPI